MTSSKWHRQVNFHSNISGDRFNFSNQFFNLGMLIHNFLNLKTNHFFWLIMNMWFHIIVNYTSEKISHSNRIDCAKYLNKNQALFRHKSHMTAELYMVCISGIQANWENWKNTQKILGYTENISKCPTPHSHSALNHFMRSIWFGDPFLNLGMHFN